MGDKAPLIEFKWKTIFEKSLEDYFLPPRPLIVIPPKILPLIGGPRVLIACRCWCRPRRSVIHYVCRHTESSSVPPKLELLVVRQQFHDITEIASSPRTGGGATGTGTSTGGTGNEYAVRYCTGHGVPFKKLKTDSFDYNNQASLSVSHRGLTGS